MPARFRRGWFFVAVLAVLVVGGWLGPNAWARPPAARLLPENTALMFSVADCPELAKRFMNTGLGRMSQDPQLSPLVKHLYGSLSDVVASLRDRIGLSLPELLAIPQGEFTFALIPVEDEDLAAVALLDAGDQLASARGLWMRVSEALDKSGATKSQENVAGVAVTIYAGIGPQQRKVIYLEKDASLVLATSMAAVQAILDAWNGGSARTLVAHPTFAAIQRRCQGEKGEEPQVMWFVDPISLVRAAGQGNAGVQLVLALLPTLGLDGLQGMGGAMAFDVGLFDSITQFHVLLENPRGGLFDVLAFIDGDSAPEPWVPNDVINYLTFHWDFKRSYKALEKVYDSIRGEGALGSQIKRRFEEPLGFDPIARLLPALEGRVTYFNTIERPVTPNSQALLLALRLKDAEAITRLLDEIASKSKGELARQSVSGKDYYQVAAAARMRRPDAPSRPLPCFAVFNDYLILATHQSLFEKVVATAEKPDQSLAAALDYKLVATRLARRSGGKKAAMLGFQRPDEGIRFVYEMALSERTRQQLKTQADRNPLFKTLDAALEQHPLPPFEVLQRYLAPGGSMLVDDETGLHYTNFTLRRK